MKRVATGLAAAIVALGSSGAHAAQASAMASDVVLQVTNIDPANPNPPDYLEAAIFTDVVAMVDGQFEFNPPEGVGFMVSMSDASPPAADASASASVSGGNTMSATAFSTGHGSAEADADTGGGGVLEVDTGEQVTFSGTLHLDSSALPGESGQAFATVCLQYQCNNYAVDDASRTIMFSDTLSNTSGNLEAVVIVLGLSAVVTSVPEPRSDGLLLAGLAMLALPAWRARRPARR